MDALTLQTALAVSAAIVLAYTVFVAREWRRDAAAASGEHGWHGAPVGMAMAIGTGLWCTIALGAFASGDLLYEAVGWHWVFGSWLVSVLAVWLVLLPNPQAVFRTRLAAALLCGLCLAVSQLLGEFALVGPEAAAGSAQHMLLLVELSGAIGAFVEQLVSPVRMPGNGRAWVVTVAAWLGLFVSVQCLWNVTESLVHRAMGPSAAGAPLRPLFGASLTVGVAFVVLSMTRLTLHIERRLRLKANQLSDSLRVANQNLKKLAYRDPLTRLSNRLFFDRKLAALVARADQQKERIALLYIDLDGFKPINDGYGHSIGDTVLREVGHRLKEATPPGATIARIGGDEFALLMPRSLSTGEASEAATRIIDLLRTPLSVKGIEIGLSCSIGIAFYPDCGESDRLLGCGDTAMYMAKRTGGSSFAFYESSALEDARGQAELMRDLRKAVERREFQLHYQPKIHADSGKVTAVEALLRWTHPKLGVIGPDIFIPLCERIGLMSRLGEWVLEEACRQLERWQRRGIRMRVAVNLSAQQLRQAGLVAMVQRLLERHGISADQLTFEVTESCAMSDAGRSHRTLVRLGALGAKISIDDFGTGYSSLAYLRQLPATELKIDRSFIRDLPTSADARAIVEAVIRLAHSLGLNVVAEGVETEEQKEVLYELGCDEFQGFLFARPLRAQTVLNWAVHERAEPRTFRPSLFVKSVFSALSDSIR